MASANFTTVTNINSIVVLSSLGDDETDTATHLVEHLQARCLAESICLMSATVKNKEEFVAFYERIGREISQNRYTPIIHIEIHGAAGADGLVLKPSLDFVPWRMFIEENRKVNQLTLNNLMVFMSVCNGFEVLLEPSTGFDLTPYSVLVGSRDPITTDVLWQDVLKFYDRLLDTNNIVEAVAVLPSIFKLYNCETVFMNAIAQYFLLCCDEESKKARVEKILEKTRTISKSMDLFGVRKRIEERIQPSKDTFEKLKDKFLMSNNPENCGRFGVSYEEVRRVAGIP